MINTLTDVVVTKGTLEAPEVVSYQGHKYRLDEARSTDRDFYFHNTDAILRIKKGDLKIAPSDF